MKPTKAKMIAALSRWIDKAGQVQPIIREGGPTLLAGMTYLMTVPARPGGTPDVPPPELVQRCWRESGGTGDCTLAMLRALPEV